MRKLFFLLLFFWGLTNLKAQTAQIIDWKFLSNIDFEDKYIAEYEAWYLMPIFSNKVKALDGKNVIIKGYVIPLDAEGGEYALSAYPFSACFFCGASGPESVMSLIFKEKPKRYNTDDVVIFTGKLKLNSTNYEQFNYVLTEVIPFKE